MAHSLPSSPSADVNPQPRWLAAIERVGNRLPDAVTIFVLLGLAVVVASWFAARTGLSTTHPVTGATVSAVNLLTTNGMKHILLDLVPNFVQFPPLGVVLAAMIGIGVAERSGLIETSLRALVGGVPNGWVTPAIILAGMLSHSAADAGFVIFPPIAAALYVRLGRNPLAGVAAAFAGVGGGFSANLLISPIDPLLAKLTQAGAQLLVPNYEVHATANYYFMATSVLVLTAISTWVSVRWVEPRLRPLHANHAGGDSGPLNSRERRGLRAAGLTCIVFICLVLWMTLPREGLLRDAGGGLKPLFDALIALVMVLFLATGLTYGIVTGTIRNDRDVAKMMTDTLGTMGTYIVLAFFASQTLALFAKSQLGPILAVEGATLLKRAGFSGAPLMLSVIAMTATINLLMSSASAKWTMMAPVFVPMLMVLGYAPETTQALYRVGDSVTNVITPLNYYLPSIIVPLCRRYDDKAGLGTVIAMMLPYSLAFGLIWSAVLIAWISFGLPVGPDAPLHYHP